MNSDLNLLAIQSLASLKKHARVLTTAESCTGGWVAKLITDLPGSSAIFERGFVTYSNAAKMEMLGVNRDTLEQFGAVSEQTVREMAQGALNHSHADTAIAISGVAGPSGGSKEKPVGTICISWAGENLETQAKTYRLEGSRNAVRAESVHIALTRLLRILESHPTQAETI